MKVRKSTMAIRKQLAFWIKRNPRLTMIELGSLVGISKKQVAYHIRNSEALRGKYLVKRSNGSVGNEIGDMMVDFILENPQAQIADIAETFGVSVSGASQFMRRNNMYELYEKKTPSGKPRNWATRDILETAMENAGGVKAHAARSLGMSPANFAKYLKRNGIFN